VQGVPPFAGTFIVCCFVCTPPSQGDQFESIVSSQFPEAEVPEAVVPEAEVPEAVVPEAEVPEAVVPEAEVPEAEVPEAVVPGAVVPEAVVPEAEVPGAVVPEAVVLTFVFFLLINEFKNPMINSKTTIFTISPILFVRKNLGCLYHVLH
jgi:hypothetical protein